MDPRLLLDIVNTKDIEVSKAKDKHVLPSFIQMTEGFAYRKYGPEGYTFLAIDADIEAFIKANKAFIKEYRRAQKFALLHMGEDDVNRKDIFIDLYKYDNIENALDSIQRLSKQKLVYKGHVCITKRRRILKHMNCNIYLNQNYKEDDQGIQIHKGVKTVPPLPFINIAYALGLDKEFILECEKSSLVYNTYGSLDPENELERECVRRYDELKPVFPPPFRVKVYKKDKNFKAFYKLICPNAPLYMLALKHLDDSKNEVLLYLALLGIKGFIEGNI